MDAEEIFNLCKALTLSDEDGLVLKISGESQREGIRRLNYYLVGKFLSRKRINREAFKSVIEQIWNTILGVEIKYVGENLFVFYFKSMEDKISVAKQLAENIGEVVEVPRELKDCWGKFLRVKVRIDVSMLLKRGLRVWLSDFEMMVTILLRYERLPDFCFACGLIGHGF
ncbi:hypothetical protein ACOSQ3_013978 [Xanthoceras sorbifolium]